MLSIFLIILQVALLALSAWYLPTRLKRTFWNFFLFLFLSVAAWFGYTLVAVYSDRWLKTDAPGMGYLVLGFIATVIGAVVYLLRPATR